MKEQPYDLEFKLYDWNKRLKDQKMGKATLKFSSISMAGSYHPLEFGNGRGTLLVFARLYRSEPASWIGLVTLKRPEARFCFDASSNCTVDPTHPLRFGVLLCLDKPLSTNGNLEITIYTRNSPSTMPLFPGNRFKDNPKASIDACLRTWQLRWPKNVDPSFETPSSSSKSSSAYGNTPNNAPSYLRPGIHFLPLELRVPPRDESGCFYATANGSDIRSWLTFMHEGRIAHADIFFRSDFDLFLKPSLPPFHDEYETFNESWPKHVKVNWKMPIEGPNRSSPLPPHLYEPEGNIAPQDQHWFLKYGAGDTKDAHGEERIYANFYWVPNPVYSDNHRIIPDDYFIVLSSYDIDTSAVEKELAEYGGKVEFEIKLACAHYTIAEKTGKSHCVNVSFKLKATGKPVGEGKTHYEVLKSSDKYPTVVSSLPAEMFGDIHEAFVYVEIYARNIATKARWMIQRRPIFVQEFEPIKAPPSANPTETPPSGQLRMGYIHFPFLERTKEETNLFGNSETSTTFGPDRLVRIMCPAANPDGSIMKGMHFTEAMIWSEEWSKLEKSDVGNIHREDGLSPTVTRTELAQPITYF